MHSTALHTDSGTDRRDETLDRHQGQSPLRPTIYCPPPRVDECLKKRDE